tara:strand:+ start:532 stop:840 length:309 start_codon:yes stop_codon:yes gene_type:complete
MEKYRIFFPLGISRVKKEEDIKGLRDILGKFEFLGVNVSRTSETAFSISLNRTKVPTARSGLKDISETVGGLVGDSLRLMFGQKIKILSPRENGVEVVFYKE